MTTELTRFKFGVIYVFLMLSSISIGIASGTTSTTKTATAIYGPYLRKVPPLPVGTNKNSTVIVDGSSGTPGSSAGGWFYNPSTGEIKANTADTEKDTAGKAYNAY